MKATCVAIAAKSSQFPDPVLPEIAFSGRSNSGKSSLINSITAHRKMARTSSTPGRTGQVFFFSFQRKTSEEIYLIDLPGYGFAKQSRATKDQWDSLITEYIESRTSLHALVIVHDIRREIQEEEKLLVQWASMRQVDALLVLTKSDKLKKNEIKLKAKQRKESCGALRVYITSSQTGSGIDTLRDDLFSRYASDDTLDHV